MLLGEEEEEEENESSLSEVGETFREVTLVKVGETLNSIIKKSDKQISRCVFFFFMHVAFCTVTRSCTRDTRRPMRAFSDCLTRDAMNKYFELAYTSRVRDISFFFLHKSQLRLTAKNQQLF